MTIKIASMIVVAMAVFFCSLAIFLEFFINVIKQNRIVIEVSIPKALRIY